MEKIIVNYFAAADNNIISRARRLAAHQRRILESHILLLLFLFFYDGRAPRSSESSKTTAAHCAIHNTNSMCISYICVYNACKCGLMIHRGPGYRRHFEYKLLYLLPVYSGQYNIFTVVIRCVKYGFKIKTKMIFIEIGTRRRCSWVAKELTPHSLNIARVIQGHGDHKF